MPPGSPFLRELARSLASGEQTFEATIARATHTLGREWRWLRGLTRRYLKAFAGKSGPDHTDVVSFFQTDPGLQHARLKFGPKLKIRHWSLSHPDTKPSPLAQAWDLPRLDTLGDLCEWLWLSPEPLDWFADLKGISGASNRLSHYSYRTLTKPNGNVRLIESPKRHLKSLQRQILSEILDRIPAHSAAHGFVKGRSIRSFAAPHTGRAVVLRMDLQDFFPTFRAARIRAFFRAIGYRESVAAALTGLCTNAVHHAPELYARPHLPQGAPTSPSLANLCCYHLDCRLAGLAISADATYTRYADDLAFSGSEEFRTRADRFATHAAAILLEEGLTVNYRKTRIMRPSVRQHLAGLTVNEKINITRREYDLLKAILTNCIRHGLETQNHAGHSDFRAHLEGRVSFVESINTDRGRKLRALLQALLPSGT